jgi:hypothetical protein
MSETSNKLPSGPIGGFSEKQFVAGSKRSQRRLHTLDFDPIERLVRLYKRLEEEDEHLVNLRKVDSVTELNTDGTTKKKHKYSGVAHVAIFGHMEKVASDLLRYDYGRVPEMTYNNDVPTSPMVIQLTDANKPPIIINPIKKDEDIVEADFQEAK